MTQIELRSACQRLFHCNTINDCKDMIAIYQEFLISAVEKHQGDSVSLNSLVQAKLVLQMVFTKLGHLSGIVDGIYYKSKTGRQLSGVIDPVVLGCHIRSMYEMVGMFNLVYRTPATSDEREILYCLWVHAGLSYRQRFESIIVTPELRSRQQSELVIMKELVDAIEKTVLYRSLAEKDQAKIQAKLKEKDYLIRFQNGEVEFLRWHKLIEVMGIKQKFLENIYTYFSLYAHPSNVAVFQFGEMYKDGQEGFEQISAFHLKNLFIFTSIFIADYINLFPNILNTYNELEPVKQIAINFYNRFTRGDDFTINDSHKALG